MKLSAFLAHRAARRADQYRTAALGVVIGGGLTLLIILVVLARGARSLAS